MSVQSIKDVMQVGLDIAAVINKVPALVAQVKSGSLAADYLALSDAEKDGLKKWLDENLVLGDQSIEKVIETAWKVLLDCNSAVSALADGISLGDVFILLSVLKKIQEDTQKGKQ